MNSTKKTVFITAGNRDIGYALVQAYLEKGYVVYTTFRSVQKSSLLLENDHPHLHKIQLNIKSSNSRKNLESFLRAQPIDIVIHNACNFGYDANKIEELNSSDWQDSFYINVIFPIQLSVMLKDNIRKSKEKKVIFISSRRGSNTVNFKDSYKGRYAYRSSKAALNSAALALSQDFLEDDISVLILHPGRVATELTNYDGMSPVESAHHIIEQIEKLTIRGTGQFLSAADGEKIGW
ncbi:MAG TPA: hypothetical protein DD412_06560 [Holosporales bacterium]|nr:hypothetical protein [Holosporales bacterium]